MQSPYRNLNPQQAARMVRALETAVALAGSWRELADRLSAYSGKQISPQGVFRWTQTGVPPERAVDLENLLEGQVLRQELRPDLYDGMRELN